VRSRPELGRVRLAQADRPGSGHPRYHQRIEIRHVIGEQRRAVGGAYPGGFGEVLVRDRQPVQQAQDLALRHRRIRIRRPCQRPVEGSGHHRVDGSVERLDPLDMSGRNLAGGHFAAPQHAGQRQGIVRAQVCHALLRVTVRAPVSDRR
jgi:hypothetical protein